MISRLIYKYCLAFKVFKVHGCAITFQSPVLKKKMNEFSAIEKLNAVNKDIKSSLKTLEQELFQVERAAYEKPILEKVLKENEELERIIEEKVRYLTELEQRYKQANPESESNDYEAKQLPVTCPEVANKTENVENKNKKVKKEGKTKVQQAPKKETNEVDAPVDVGRLDLKVGQIVEIKKHPDADSLYVEQINIGKPAAITVVSGLVKHVPIEEMENRMVVILGNLKPVKMRGVTSEAMVMCASTPDKVEVLSPPIGSSPGDVITVSGYKHNPDPVLNPKKKIFETVAPDLKTDSDCIATYKGARWSVEGKGYVSANTLIGAPIK
ncbi:aminoacyl tRNA synthase complex-interacting multifunctional protein 1 [Cimex lectularius]|uniref:tRNA-binding domain-containing protein n=1 Tax=Cimex lectularius TaxID=79782 RepID=A0A8I6SMP2_CIMLE|nr:aminoacyl tRNA synthase complex-interacting multifunctional protein 1 [Cimex lectularius]